MGTVNDTIQKFNNEINDYRSKMHQARLDIIEIKNSYGYKLTQDEADFISPIIEEDEEDNDEMTLDDDYAIDQFNEFADTSTSTRKLANMENQVEQLKEWARKNGKLELTDEEISFYIRPYGAVKKAYAIIEECQNKIHQKELAIIYIKLGAGLELTKGETAMLLAEANPEEYFSVNLNITNDISQAIIRFREEKMLKSTQKHKEAREEFNAFKAAFEDKYGIHISMENDIENEHHYSGDVYDYVSLNGNLMIMNVGQEKESKYLIGYKIEGLCTTDYNTDYFEDYVVDGINSFYWPASSLDEAGFKDALTEALPDYMPPEIINYN